MLPSLLWEHGAIVRMMVKPMALDPLFWDIVGLNENAALPLSFRANGAWVLRPPWTESFVGLNSAEVQPLAKEVLGWANEWTCKMLETISVESMLKSLVSEQTIRGQNLALATCLHILMRDLNGAMDLCRIDDPDLHPMMRDSGGFTTHNHDGSSSTFLDQARDWIARKRRDELSIV